MRHVNLSASALTKKINKNIILIFLNIIYWSFKTYRKIRLNSEKKKNIELIKWKYIRDNIL